MAGLRMSRALTTPSEVNTSENEAFGDLPAGLAIEARSRDAHFPALAADLSGIFHTRPTCRTSIHVNVRFVRML